MADKGILVQSVEGGESIACTDARNVDTNSNPRLFQLSSNVTSPGLPTIDLNNAIRQKKFDGWGMGSEADDMELSGKCDALYNSMLGEFRLLDVSDTEVFVTYTLLKDVSNGDGLIRVAPLLVNLVGEGANAYAAVCGFLPRYVTHPMLDYSNTDTTTATVSACLRYYDDEDTEGTYYLSMVHQYPTLGAKYIGFHLSAVEQDTMQGVWAYVFGYKLTGSTPVGMERLAAQWYASDLCLNKFPLDTVG